DPTGKVLPLVAVGWTLNYEMFFYLLFALGLRLGWPILAPVLIICALAAIGWALRPQAVIPHFYTASLLVEFAFGLLLSRALFFRNATLGLLSAAAGLAVLLSWGLDTDTPQWRVLFWGVPAAAIVAGLLAVERAGMFPQNALW